MPSMLFYNIAKTDPPALLDLNFLFCYEAVTILLILTTVVIGTNINKSITRSTVIGLNISYPNYGYIGIPMCILAFGSSAAIPLALILLADTFVILTLSSLAISVSEKGISAKAMMYSLIKRIISQPLLIAVCLGMIFSRADVKIYPVFEVFIETIAGGAAPVALLALGASISFKLETNQKFELFTISICKLLLHPILLITVFYFFPAKDPVFFQTAVLCASLPIAANVFVLADYYGTYQKESARAIILTTILSTFSVPVILYIILNLVNGK